MESYSLKVTHKSLQLPPQTVLYYFYTLYASIPPPIPFLLPLGEQGSKKVSQITYNWEEKKISTYPSKSILAPQK